VKANKARNFTMKKGRKGKKGPTSIKHGFGK
jgi:hypothetical protein